MSSHWIDPQSCESLAVLIESVAAPMLIEHGSPVCLELDVDVWLCVPADPQLTADLVRILVRQALVEMPDGGDLTVTACETPRGIELEIADTGRDVEERSKSLPLVAAAVGARMQWQNCPQGGGAVTITFPRQADQKRRAA